jgi:hypothetical protein
LILVGAPGCGKGYEQYAKVPSDLLAIEAEKAQILKTVKDDGSMKEARSRLDKLALRAEEVARRAKALGEPSVEVRQKLEDEFAGRLQQALNQTRAEIRRIQDLPGGPDFLQQNGLSSGESPRLPIHP